MLIGSFGIQREWSKNRNSSQKLETVPRRCDESFCTLPFLRHRTKFFWVDIKSRAMMFLLRQLQAYSIRCRLLENALEYLF